MREVKGSASSNGKKSISDYSDKREGGIGRGVLAATKALSTDVIRGSAAYRRECSQQFSQFNPNLQIGSAGPCRECYRTEISNLFCKERFREREGGGQGERKYLFLNSLLLFQLLVLLLRLLLLLF